jgi:two-component system response regulator AlgR
MKIIIADDEPLARVRLQALVEELGMGEVVAEARNGKEVLSAVHAYQPEIILLDIRMPGMDGMQTAEALASLHPQPAVIFTTAYSDHAVEAFERQAVDYLMKPIRKERLEQAFKRAYTFIQNQLANPPSLPTPVARSHISYYLHGERRVVPVNQIYYFLSEQKYVTLRWAEGEVLINEALRDLEKEFAGQFLRIHRSALVAMVQIAGFFKDKNGRSYLRLKDVEEPLEVSRRHLQTVKSILKDMRLSYQ